MLGLLEADSDGNINVSKRGPRCMDYVGAGGLPDLAASARSLLFCGSWMAHAKIDLVDGQVRIVKPGAIKFKDKVSEITFSGQQALAKGKKVYYITNVGVFQLTKRGMTLIQVMPGIDIQRDILAVSPMKIVLPEGDRVPVVTRDIVTGEGFRLRWPGA
jgi:propionate CoA-transferase